MALNFYFYFYSNTVQTVFKSVQMISVQTISDNRLNVFSWDTMRFRPKRFSTLITFMCVFERSLGTNKFVPKNLFFLRRHTIPSQIIDLIFFLGRKLQKEKKLLKKSFWGRF